MPYQFLAHALEEWRAAECRLSRLEQGTREWAEAEQAVEAARDCYHRLADGVLLNYREDEDPYSLPAQGP